MRNSWTRRLLAAALIGGGSISVLAAVSGPVSAGDAPSGTITVGLHNTSTDDVQTCSEVPGLVTPAWHFVAPGGSLVNINFLLVGGTTYPNPFYLPYPDDQHAYVTVPSGESLDDLEGGEFLITETDKVVLSHLCTGPTTDTTTTTTTTTSTEPPSEESTTTTTTIKESTTSSSTTTKARTSTPTTIAVESVSVAAAASEPAAAPTTTVPLATQLPATGSSSWTLFFVGLASALGGLGLIRISRRPV